VYQSHSHKRHALHSLTFVYFLPFMFRYFYKIAFTHAHSTTDRISTLKIASCFYPVSTLKFSNTLRSSSTMDQGLNCCILNAHYVFHISTILIANPPVWSAVKTLPWVKGQYKVWQGICHTALYLDKTPRNIFLYFFMIHVATLAAAGLNDHMNC
jgi:hypothetical protein